MCLIFYNNIMFKIAITSKIKRMKNGDCYLYCYENYFKAFGNDALVFMIDQNFDKIEHYSDFFDALIITGGCDIDPLFYCEKPINKNEEFFSRLDEYEIEIIKSFYKKQKPILGICRGLQIINVCFGGSLYQDINSQLNVNHNQFDYDEDDLFFTHQVKFNINGLLYDIFGEKYNVNTYHHQAIKKLADGFLIEAISDDGIIEAISLKKDIIAVQWHPEKLLNDKKQQELFKYFINILKERNNK